jgi:hypothetical protein
LSLFLIKKVDSPTKTSSWAKETKTPTLKSRGNIVSGKNKSELYENSYWKERNHF